MNNKNITVSVLVLAYNVAPYIQECLRGIMAQEVDFEYEVLIGEDCSTDETLEKINELELPDNFFLFNREKNLGLNENNIDLLKKAQGKYIAICDGDDIWIFASKLSEQVKIMEVDSRLSGCFTGAQYVMDGVEVENENEFRQGKLLNFYHLLKNNWVTNSTVLYRNRPELYKLEYIRKTPIQDYQIHFLNLSIGDYYFSNQKTVEYTIRAGGDYNGVSTFTRLKRTNEVLHLLLCNSVFDLYRKKILERKSEISYSLSRFGRGEIDLFSQFSYLFQSVSLKLKSLFYVSKL